MGTRATEHQQLSHRCIVATEICTGRVLLLNQSQPDLCIESLIWKSIKTDWMAFKAGLYQSRMAGAGMLPKEIMPFAAHHKTTLQPFALEQPQELLHSYRFEQGPAAAELATWQADRRRAILELVD